MRIPALRAVASIFVSAIALSFAGGCKTLSAADHQIVLAHLENAAQYYDGGRYPNALQQWGRALDIDPDEERALLGQGWAMYQLGCADTRDGLGYLVQAEQRLDGLRGGRIGNQSWKAELGYGLVQARWAQLYDEAVRRNEATAATGRVRDAALVKADREELRRRTRLAEDVLLGVLDAPGTEPAAKLTTWLALARVTAIRGDFEKSLDWCRKFVPEIEKARDYFRKKGPKWETSLFGATIQEAELRDVMGNTLFKLGRFDEAEAELSTLVALQPNRATAYLNRAILREARGAWDLARSDFAQFLSKTDLASDDPGVLEAEKRRLLCEERLAAEEERERSGH